MSTDSLKPGQVIADRYRIECLLGQGGMGSVYRAAQLPMARPVAVKVLVEQSSESQTHVKRFEREARALAKLSHPNTVRLFEFGTTKDGQPFLAMELLDGVDLQRWLRRGRAPWDQALRICLQVLRSLEEAHSRGIVHRDIKPANIFLCPVQGQALFVKVLDFGIAGRLDRAAATTHLTAAGTVIGSAAYMSPEQTEGAPIGTATDLYAVGVVLFEILTGMLPFRAVTLAGLYVAKATQPALHLSDVCADLDVPPALHRLVDELLQRDPASRPSCARTVAERVEALLGGMPPRPPAEAEVGAVPRAQGPRLVARTEPLTVAPAAGGHTGDDRAREAISAGGVERTVRNAKPGVLRRSGVALALFVAAVAAAGLLRIGFPPPAPVPTFHDRADVKERQLEPLAKLPPPEEPPPSTPAALANIEKHTPATHEDPPARLEQPLVAGGTQIAQPTASSDLARRYPTVASVRAARDAGKIGQLDSNALIRSLREQRLNARTRAGNEYKAGKIGLDELKQRQQQIEEAFEGPPP